MERRGLAAAARLPCSSGPPEHPTHLRRVGDDFDVDLALDGFAALQLPLATVEKDDLAAVAFGCQALDKLLLHFL